MNIAQVAPLYESVPPKFYGGTERVVSYLTEELVRLGHDVTLFASGDSVTAARLFSQCPRALRLDGNAVDLFAPHIVMLEQVIQRASDFDLIHFHVDYLHFPWSRRQPVPNLTTLHGRLDIPDLVPLYGEFREMPVVSISDAQRQPLPWLNWQATVHHGLPPDLYRLHERTGKYLAFVGRICREKRVDRAIEIARRSGMELRIAAKIDKVDREYFKDEIKPLLNQPFIDFVGEIGEREKDDFLGDALAVISPIDWPEPFGLVMIEAMACGTPVIAFRRGSAPEVVDDGVTGYVVDTIDEAVAAVEQAAKLDRNLCRKVFERRFSVGRMALDYIRVYEQICQPRMLHGVGRVMRDYAITPPPPVGDEATIADASQDTATGSLDDFS
jgi:glycosyltransferase involved in cell wall biosynthesis